MLFLRSIMQPHSVCPSTSAHAVPSKPLPHSAEMVGRGAMASPSPTSLFGSRPLLPFIRARAEWTQGSRQVGTCQAGQGGR